MRNTLLASAAIFGLALALPAFAQTATDQNAANPSADQNGTPAAGTDAPLSSQAKPGSSGPFTNQPSPAQTAPSSGASTGTDASGASAAPPAASATPDSSTSGGTDSTTAPRHHAMRSSEGSGHWAHQPGTGESGPASAKASNIDSADTRSVIAPHLPSPGVGKNAGPERYLEVADRALRAHKTGEAQQALEMAETRLLDRSTEAGSASQPDQNPRIAAVTAARKALAAKDWEGARKNIQEAMNRGEGDMAKDSGASSSGGMASGTTAGGTGTTTSSVGNTGTSTATGAGEGTTSTMAPNSTSQGVAGGNAGATPAPMDPSAQGPASAGAAGTPTTGASATAPNQMQPASGAK